MRAAGLMFSILACESIWDYFRCSNFKIILEQSFLFLCSGLRSLDSFVIILITFIFFSINFCLQFCHNPNDTLHQFLHYLNCADTCPHFNFLVSADVHFSFCHVSWWNFEIGFLLLMLLYLVIIYASRSLEYRFGI